MARKELNYTVTDEGRDKGKLFVITEMSARKAESWAIRALLSLIKNGANLPEGFENNGMAGLAEAGIKALSGLRYDDAEPLLEEMMQCVEIIPDPSRTHIKRQLIEEDIEEIKTLAKLRMAVLNLHVDFSKAVAPSTSSQAAATESITQNT